MRAVVTAAICPLMSGPALQCERADEALGGMIVELLEDTGTGWRLVRTHYGYTGYAPEACLLFGEETAARWAGREKKVVLRGACDVLAWPDVAAWPVTSLVRGTWWPRRGRRRTAGSGAAARRPGGPHPGRFSGPEVHRARL